DVDQGREALGDVHRHPDAAVGRGVEGHVGRAVHGDLEGAIDLGEVHGVVHGTEQAVVPPWDEALELEVARRRVRVTAEPLDDEVLVVPGGDVADQGQAAALVHEQQLSRQVDLDAV